MELVAQPMNAYTNRDNIPTPLAEAIKVVSEEYSVGKSDFTTTELTGPPRIRALRLKAKKQGITITHDVTDMLHSVMGSAVHYILDMWAKDQPDYTSEERLYREFAGVTIGGQLDLYRKSDGTLWDWKYTKSTTYRDGVKAEYVQQLNINAWLLEGNGHEVKTLVSAPIYRDFSKITAQFKAPHVHSEEFVVPKWDTPAVENLLRSRIEIHRQAEVELPQCTEDERWATKSKWATQSITSGRAIRYGLSDTQEEAEKKRLAHKKPNTLAVVHRPGTSPRCEHYCPVASICSQWAENPCNPANIVSSESTNP